MGSREQLEVEVKFLVRDLTAVRRRLLDLGATVTKERVFERNLRFDTSGQSLRSQDKLLRLRQDTAVTVTFKGMTDAQAGSEARVREELEFEADDFDIVALVFRRLGFQPVQTYEKYRETFALDDVEVVLDEMPYGDFVELEGEEADLKTAVVDLGLNWQQRILANYLALMADLKAHHDLPFDDLTFANFENLSASVADLLPYASEE